MRREVSDAGSLADALNHAPKRLLARRHFRILSCPLTLVLRDPLLDFHREDVIVELGLQVAKASAKQFKYVRRERDRLPVSPFAEHVHTPPDQVDVGPSSIENLGAPKTRALH